MNKVDSVIFTRLQPPARAKNIIKRKRLLTSLENNSSKNLLLVTSPAGYGKTTLVQNYVNEYNLNVVWMHVLPDINNIYTFFTYLVSAFRIQHPAFGDNTLEIINSCRVRYELTSNLKSIVTNIISTFLNDFYGNFQKDTYIVLDDLGNLENSEWLKLSLNMLFENIPSNMHIVVTTRQVPDFNISYLYAKRNVFKLDTNDLTFRPDEISELLKQEYHVTLGISQITSLEKQIGGWITGIHLLLQAYGDAVSERSFDDIKMLDNIFNYFADDIFKKLDENIQNFLLDTALLEDFTVEKCNRLLNINNAVDIIEKILSKNIFIQATSFGDNGSSGSLYNYQLLFKKFLTAKLYEIRSKNEITSHLKKICKDYILSGDIINGIKFAIASEDYSKAIKLINKKFQELFDSGKFEILWEWINSFDETILNSNAGLLYYKSLLLKYYSGDINEAKIFIEKALDIYKREGKTEDVTKCLIAKGRYNLSDGQIKEAINIFLQIISSKGSNENIIRAYYYTSYGFYLISDYDSALKHLESAVKATTRTKYRAMRQIYNLYGHIYLIRGEYLKSAYYYEMVVKEAASMIDVHETYCNLILLYSQAGKFDKARKYLNKAKDIAERIPIPIFQLAYKLAEQASRFEIADYEENIRILEATNALCLKINHKYYTFLTYRLLADSYYYLNRLTKAEEYYSLAFSHLDDDNPLEKQEFAMMKALQMKKSQTDSSIENVLQEVYEYYKSNKFIYNMMQAAYHLADFYIKNGQLKSAKEYLSKSLQLANEKEYYSFIQREFLDSQRVMDFARANNIEKSFVKFIVSTLYNRHETDWISQEAKARIKNKISELYDVTVTTFGKLEFKVKNYVIPESSWPKKKWKLILLYLFLSQKKEVTKDKLIDVFYTDTPLTSAENIFHQIVSKFRNLIKFNSESGTESLIEKTSKENKPVLTLHPSVFIYEDKTLKLNKELNYNIDIENFEKYYKLFSAESISDIKLKYAEKALSVYKGEFLDGFYESWVEELRTGIQLKTIEMNEEVLKILDNSEKYEQASLYADNLLKADKLNEDAYYYSIKAYINLNKISMAKDKFNVMLKAYKDEGIDIVLNSKYEKIKKLLNK